MIGKHSDELIQEVLSNFGKIRFDRSYLILGAVTGSTFRAYGSDEGEWEPQSVFRSWAWVFLETQRNEIESSNDFEMLHSNMVHSLIGYWKENDKRELPTYQAWKLVDLLCKRLPCWADLSDNRRKWFLKHAHVPIDKFSLNLLRISAPDFAKNLGIKEGVSMGWLKGQNEKYYYPIQEKIREICSQYPPLVFDLLAWNEERKFGLHQKKTKPQQKLS